MIHHRHRLLPIISNILNFLKGKIENFEDGFLNQLGKDKKNNFQFIGNKRSPDGNVEDTLKESKIKFKLFSRGKRFGEGFNKNEN